MINKIKTDVLIILKNSSSSVNWASYGGKNVNAICKDLVSWVAR